jgi:hypothetical protein
MRKNAILAAVSAFSEGVVASPMDMMKTNKENIKRHENCDMLAVRPHLRVDRKIVATKLDVMR